MSSTKKRIFAAILLILLITVPFLDWKLGAFLWMCAWLVYIFQNLYYGRPVNRDGENKPEDEQDL